MTEEEMKQLRENIPEFAKEWAEECMKQLNIKIDENMKYYIIRADHNNAETIFETGNKAQVEKNFRRLYKAYCNEKKKCVSLLTERHFVVDDDYWGRQEYWIEKF